MEGLCSLTENKALGTAPEGNVDNNNIKDNTISYGRGPPILIRGRLP